MLRLKSISIRNFLSVGNAPQVINFQNQSLTLIMGCNKDNGSDGNEGRNGVGKSTITHAISYAKDGQALTNIRKDFLVNRSNGKQMMVILSFEKDGVEYRIERGRKPAVLKLFINNEPHDADQDEKDEAQGESRETQKYIDEIFGMDHLMFKSIVMLNTYTDPFLAMKVSDQREVIENLLGITILSEKAEALKLLIKKTKDEITSENAVINAITESNKNISNSIETLKVRQQAWATKREEDCVALYYRIESLKTIDIDTEINNHALLETYLADSQKLSTYKKELARLERDLASNVSNYERYTQDLINLQNNLCPACEQSVTNHKHEIMRENTFSLLTNCEKTIEQLTNDKIALEDAISGIVLGDKPITHYAKLSEALSHQNTLMTLENTLTEKAEMDDPYQEQISTMEETAMQDISYDKIDALNNLKNHQEFLLKLLTSKDSFIRKKIIEQNLSYLNTRLAYYLNKIGLIHLVIFQNDMSVEITYMGHALDFHNLSRGEMTRVTLSLSWAFRDVWENLYNPINLLFVDELMDNGMDKIGADNALAIMKAMTNRSIFLISHKEELVNSVNNVLLATKENGFTNYALTNI